MTWKGLLRTTSKTQELNLVPETDQGIDVRHPVGPIYPLIEMSTGRHIVDHGRAVFMRRTGERVTGANPFRVLVWVVTALVRTHRSAQIIGGTMLVGWLVLGVTYLWHEREQLSRWRTASLAVAPVGLLLSAWLFVWRI